MAITDFKVTDPYSGDESFTKTPKQFKGHWVTPGNYRVYKETKDKSSSQHIRDGYKQFRRMVNLFRSA